MNKNILIAEFMGATIIGSGEHTLIAFPDTKITDDDGNYAGSISNNRSLKDLHYDTDWNWLMLVVDEIHKVNDFDFCVSIDANICQIWSEDRIYDETEDGFSTIEATYKAVVNFINWYNKNNNHV